MSFVFLASALSPLASAAATNPVRIDAMDVTVTIDHHYAKTAVRETLTNPSDHAIEFRATVASPELSFVTRFALETGGAVYESTIEEASSARGAYDATLAAAGAAALIETRDTHTFSVSLNLPAATTVVVDLAYEEMIARADGRYVYRFPLVASSAGKTVGLLSIGGTLTGSATIPSSEVSLGAVSAPSATSLSFSHHSSHLVPGADFVLIWTEASPTGVGTLLTHVSPDSSTFVHVFSAEGAGLGATPLPKDIVFVIDVSGSMEESLPQVKAVFSSIIADLGTADRFSVVAFSGGYWVWSPSLADADAGNRQSAREWVESLSARSSTDIDLGLSVGIQMLPQGVGRAPALVLLSDGEPTSGVTREGDIRDNLRARNGAGASVYTLAFGPDADFGLMQALALENGGEVRRIWLGQDTGAQIRGFYDSIATPLLQGVSVVYTEGVESAMPTHFARAFAGSDLVTVGKLAPRATTVAVTITGNSASGAVSFSGRFDVGSQEAGAFVERAYAFERIRALERPASLGDSAARAEIVSIALHYRFVTDYTSLVVVVPVILTNGATASPVPLRVTTAGALAPSDSPPPTAYAATPPPKAAPGAGALLAVFGLVGVAFAVRRTRKTPAIEQKRRP